MSNTAKQGFVFLLFFLLHSLPPSAAQPTLRNGENPSYARLSPSLAAVLGVLIVALILIVFFSIYMRNRYDNANGSSVNHVNGGAARSRRGSRGLDASVIETFPTMVYSEVKAHKIGKGALECAVCLNEFEVDETLRLMPKCDHAFHTECIDAWLASHTTCPVCRANLAPQPGEPVVSQPTELNETGAETDLEAQNVSSDSEPEEERRINNNNVNSVAEPQVASEVGPIGLNRTLNRNRTRGSISSRTRKLLVPRSQSTGHSLVQPGESTDRFTLRLPAEIRNQLTNQKLNRATSLVLPKESSSSRGYRAAEDDGSSRGRFFNRLNKIDRAAKSDRWLFNMSLSFFNRASSIKSPGANGEGSSSFPVGPRADSSRPQV
ncbi:putative excision repair cross-complementing 1 ercc1 [Hibiscus syriacus]|uniref:RING-type E3 ubiquitin transferase n=1 Tax=Hibiscus syriacus TaxID=106335 RepID=A0A6A3BYA7_HIBSY|nr:E3 ubiquitin-protein ligase ATL6-like [Hibiscus syriacus]KAE8720917.1 putative excision repair cross-complementing 1 ercc1 [Hibiscus syriacus]